jgi:hypothetical protein
MMKFSGIFGGLLVAIVCLSACATIPETNVDPSKNNQAAFRKDLAECKEDYPQMSSGVNFRQWQGCMSLKGWK